MATIVKISKLNPLRFYQRGVGLAACDSIPSYELPGGYNQKYLITDELRFQISLLEDRWNAVSYKVYNTNNNVVLTKTGGLIGTVDGYNIWSVRTDDNILSSISTGVFYVEVKIELIAEGDVYFISEQFEVLTELPDSILIKYSHDVNNWDMVFYPSELESSKQTYQLRVEGTYLSDGFMPASKDTFFIDQDRDVLLLDSIPYNVYRFTFGDPGLPNWIADKLNRVFSLYETLFDDVAYLKNEGAKLDRVGAVAFPLAQYKIDMVRSERDDSEIVTGVDEIPMPINVKYGYMYSLFTFFQSSKVTSSDDWRLPTLTEITSIYTLLGGQSIAGGKLKSTRTSPTAEPRWTSPNTGATNIVNFSAMPGGLINESDGQFYSKNTEACFWTSTLYFEPTDYYYFYMLINNSARLYCGLADGAVSSRYAGMSIRILRDATSEELLLADGASCDDYLSNDLRIYPTVKLGNYVILAVNLAETKYRDGSLIVLIDDNANWLDNAASGCMAAFNNDLSNVLM